MKKLASLALTVLLALPFVASAQGGYVIQGNITGKAKLSAPKVYLARHIGREVAILDSAKIKGGKFTFKGTAPARADRVYLSAPGMEDISLLLEAGTITVQLTPGEGNMTAQVTGTPCNNVMNDYARLMEQTATGLPAPERGAIQQTEGIKFLRAHLDEDAALFIIEDHFMNMFTAKTLSKEFMRALGQNVLTHPLYTHLDNILRARQLKVGSFAPKIKGQTPEGGELVLDSLRGKYLLLHIWEGTASEKDPEADLVRVILNDAEQNDKLQVAACWIGKGADLWKKAIQASFPNQPAIKHFSTLLGWNADIVELFNIKRLPANILLNPDGRVITFTLGGEDLHMKAHNIITGAESFD